LVWLLLAPAALADVDPLAQAHQKAVPALTHNLLELARWCDEQRLWRDRDRVYELVLHFAPDHARARRGLKYERDEQGAWVRPKPYRQPANHNRNAEGRLVPRRRLAVEPFVAAMLDALERGDEGVAPPADPDVRRRVLRDLLVLDPNNALVRARNGEVWDKKRWVLQETATARERREVLREVAREAQRGVRDPAIVRPSPFEAGLKLSWQAGLQGEWWRALGTVKPAELRRVLRLADASFLLFKEAFSTRSRRPEGCVLYVLRGHGEARTMLEAHPRFTAADRGFFLQLTSAWVPRSRHLIEFGASREERLDGVARQAIGLLLLTEFNVTAKRGWVWEGFGFYLDHLLTGTRLNLFVRRGGIVAERADFWARLDDHGDDWLGIARELETKGWAPDLRALTAKDVNEMGLADIISAHAFAAYLLEGRPAQVGAFLRAYGHTKNLDRAITKAFATTLEDLGERSRRWLREMAPED
jgi:hypothetical protein